MSVADEIKARLDIVQYVQQFAPLKRAGKSYKACCPFHSEKTPSFVVNPDSQSWRCFGQCAEGGDVISFAMKKNGWSFTEALQELGKLTGVEVQKQTPEQRQQNDRLDVMRGMLQAAADAYHQLLTTSNDADAVATLQYTREKRGFTDETINRFQVGYAMSGWTHMLDYLKQLGYTEDMVLEAGMAVRNDQGRIYDRFRNRLMIPIRDDRGRVIGFGARALAAEDNPKYLNSPQTALFDKSRTLFGLDTAKAAIRESETAVIVEGYMDAIQAHQAGFTNVVAQMGTAMTETQIRILTRTAKKIILALDSDAAGQNATMRSLETARATLQADYSGRLSIDIRILQIPGAKDPDDLIRESPERWAELVANATPVADYVIDVETCNLPQQASVQEREAVARRLLPILSSSENSLYKKDNLQKLALRLRIAERDLLAWADEQERIERAKPPRKAAPNPAQPPTSFNEPPEAPPLDYDAAIPPEETDYSLEGVSILPATPMRRMPMREVPLETRCLRMLFQRPDAYYAVNRKLRELVEDKPELAARKQALLDGPLGEWCAEDFSHTEAHALMDLFQAAMQQDELEALDYLRRNADDSLQMQIDAILADDLEGVRARVRDGHAADLALIWNNNRRYIEAVDLSAELVDKALRLRLKRLQREREELSFLQMDLQTNDDSEAEIRFQQHIWLSNIARQLIDAELKKLTSALRE